MKNTDKMTNRKALTYVMENFTLPDDVAEKLSAMPSTQSVGESLSTSSRPTAT